MADTQDPGMLAAIIAKLRGKTPPASPLVHPAIIGKSGMTQKAAQEIKNFPQSLEDKIAANGG